LGVLVFVRFSFGPLLFYVKEKRISREKSALKPFDIPDGSTKCAASTGGDGFGLASQK